jgi:hypothetical protein
VTGWETLLGRALLILRSAASAGSLVRDWTLGGGTALMLRYHHRESADIDIFVPDPQVLGHLSPRLNPQAEFLSSNYLEQAGFLKLYFSEGQIDFVACAPLTRNPATRATLIGHEMWLETPSEIIAKKIWYRASAFKARDLFDLALVADREPGALLEIGDILTARRSALLARIDRAVDALREDFEALETLDYAPDFDECLETVRRLLGSAPHRAEQRLARYAAGRLALALPFPAGAEIGL